MAKSFTGRSIDNILLSEIDAPIGSYRDSDLSPEEFSTESVGVWLLCDGRSCLGTAYAQKTGKNTVPDFATSGAFRRQVKGGRLTGTLEAEDFKSHTHIQNAHTHIQDAHNHTQSPHGHTGVNRQATSWWDDDASSGTHATAGHSNSQLHYTDDTTATNIASTATNQNTTATNQNSGGTETRPVNIGVNVYIKVGY